MRTVGIKFLGHTTVCIDLAGQVLLTDPILTTRIGHLSRVSRALVPADIKGTQLVLLSHLHSDHLNLPSLRRLPPKTLVVVPRGAGDWLRAKIPCEVTELAPGEVLEHGTVTVHGVFADHAGLRWGPRLSIGPQAQAMGHIIEGAGVRIYAAGDTDIFDGMADFGDIDVAFLPVWGWGPNIGPGHMDPQRAARAADIIKPKVAIPVHWGTLSVTGLRSLPGKHGNRMRMLLKDPPHEFAHAITGPTKVVVLQPGEGEMLTFE